MGGKWDFAALWSRMTGNKLPVAETVEAELEPESVRGVADMVASRQAAIARAEQEEDWKSAARSAAELCNVGLLMGEWQAIVSLVQRAEAWLRRQEDPLTRLYLHSRLAVARHRFGQLAESQRLFQEAEQWQGERQTRYQWLIGLPGSSYCELLLDLAREAGDWERVLHRSQYSQKVVKNIFAVAMDWLAQGRALAGLGREEEARVALQQAVAMMRKANRRLFLPEFLLQQGHFLRRCGEAERAHALWQEAWQIADSAGLPPLRVDCQLLAGHLAVDAGETTTAETAMTAAGEGIATLGYGQRQAEWMILRARLRHHQGRTEEATTYWQASRALVEAKQQWGVWMMWQRELRQPEADQ